MLSTATGDLRVSQGDSGSVGDGFIWSCAPAINGNGKTATRGARGEAIGKLVDCAKCMDFFAMEGPKYGYYLEPDKSAVICTRADEPAAKAVFLNPQSRPCGQLLKR